MKRPEKFDVWLANLNPQRGTEVGKVRPVLVIQSDLLNEIHPSTVILPFTTNIILDSTLLRINFQKGIGGLQQDSALILDQIRAIDSKNFIDKLGRIPDNFHALIDQNLKIILDLT